MADAPTAPENREQPASADDARRAEAPTARTGTTLAVRALLLGERLPIPPAEARQVLAVSPTTIRVGETGFAVLHRYGVVVLFGVPPDQEARLLNELAEQSQGRLRTLESEEARIVVDPAQQEGLSADGQIQLKDLAPERLQTVADVLAKSTVLDFHETRMAAAFDRVEPLTVALQRGRRLREETRELLRHIGDVLITEHRMVGRVGVSESPEVLWEHPELERLYLRLAQEYELRERDAALTRKLDLILRTVSTVLDITQNRRSLRVEWYIVILIVVEILLTLYEMLTRGG